jgi:TniQ
VSSAQLLVRPPLAGGEGLRGFVCRLSNGNDAALLFAPMLKSLGAVTAAVPEIAQLTTESQTALLGRGTLVPASANRPGGRRFGSVVLPDEVVRKPSRRAVCPICVARGGVSLCAWDLRAYDTCHLHRVGLVDRCHGCRRQLSWSSHACACGFPMGELPAVPVPAGRARICAVLAKATLTSIHCDSVQPAPATGRSLPIDWALFLKDFFAEVMLPRFERLKEMVAFDADGTRHDELVAAMLEDVRYRDYVRDVLFLHAAADPMTLLEALRPGQDAPALRTRFKPCWRELSFHRSLWIAQQKARRRVASRAVRRLVRAGALRAACREPMPRSAPLESGPPAAWLGASWLAAAHPPLHGVGSSLT